MLSRAAPWVRRDYGEAATFYGHQLIPRPLWLQVSRRRDCHSAEFHSPSPFSCTCFNVGAALQYTAGNCSYNCGEGCGRAPAPGCDAIVATIENITRGFDGAFWHCPFAGLSLPFRWPFAALSLAFRWPFAALSLPFRCPFTVLSLAFRCPFAAKSPPNRLSPPFTAVRLRAGLPALRELSASGRPARALGDAQHDPQGPPPGGGGGGPVPVLPGQLCVSCVP